MCCSFVVDGDIYALSVNLNVSNELVLFYECFVLNVNS
jgi:hypothetical protein